MKGNRRYAQLPPLEAGDYCQDWKGFWHGRSPTGLACNLSNHTVVEHDDRTITVTPSILIAGGLVAGVALPSWHGYLTKGEWTEA